MTQVVVRYQSPTPNARGVHAGVFALVNGLAAQGVLTADQESFRRVSNDWFHDNLADPAVLVPGIYDRELNPGATAWFKLASTHLTERIAGYLAILDAVGVPWERIESEPPGRVIYEDDDQVIVAPK